MGARPKHVVETMTNTGHPKRDQPRRSIGTTLSGRVFRLCLALAVEVALLVFLEVWLGYFTSYTVKYHSRIPVSIHWVVRTRVRLKKPEVHARIHSMLEPPFPSLLPATFARQASGVLTQDLMPIKKSVLLDNIPWTPQNGGRGLVGEGMWVDVPIPGGGGLPATGLQVVQTHINCGPTIRGPIDPVWLAGRVSRSGRVISTWVMRSSDRARVNRLTQKYVDKWRFKPLQINGHPTWFHIVLIVWWRRPPEALLRHPLYRSPGKPRCIFPLGPLEAVPSDMPARPNGVMPHWVLYPLKGHHPLAVLLAYGPYPDPEVAQAVALYLNYLEGKLRVLGGK